MSSQSTENSIDTEAAEAKFKLMTESKVESLILKLAFPTIVSMLITSIYNMADTFFVGQIGTSATGAVGVVFPLMAIIQAVGFFFGHGAGNFISRKLGAKQLDEANEMASTGFFSALIGGCVIMVCGLLFTDPLARLLGATDTILPYARQYLRIIVCGAPYMTASLTLNNQLRFQGNAFYAMLGIGAGGILNIVLDPILIFGLDMGTGGAALATIISQFVSFIVLFIGVTHKGIPIRFRNFKPNRYYLKEITRGGIPSLFRQGCASVATVCLNQMAGVYGADAAIAAMSIVQRITMFAASALIGYGQGFQPVCGFNYGAKRTDRVKRGFWFCVKSSFLVLLVLAILGGVFAPQIIAFFRKDDAAVIEIGAFALRMQCITFPLTGYVVMCNMMAQTIGESVKATILAMSRQFLFFVPSLLVLSALMGLTGVEISQTVSDGFSFVVSVAVGYSILRKWK